ncbi:MAG: hypothetical protein ACKVOB_03435 [Sphingomonas sp.]
MKLKHKSALALASALILPVLFSAPAVAQRDDDQKFDKSQEVGYLGRTSSDALTQSKFAALRDRRATRRVNDTADRVLAWHENALDAVAIDHTPPVGGRAPLNNGGPVRTSRALAMTQIAVFDALNAFSGKFQAYNTLTPAPRGASKDAAIAYASHGVLSVLYPAQKVQLDVLLSSDVSSIRGSAASIAAGRAVGEASAAAIIRRRTNDGSEIREVNFGGRGRVASGTTNFYGEPVNGGSTAPFRWTPDPLTPGDTPGTTLQLALGASWGAVKPFVIRSGDQFRAPPPPLPGTPGYAAGFNDVKAVGASSSPSTATAQTRFIGNYWGYDGAPLLGTPPRLYGQIAVKIATENGVRSALGLARLLAMVDTAQADAGVAAWDSKYFYNYWRPVTGVPRGAEDGDAATVGDPNWKPVGISVINTTAPILATPPFPAYVSGHATFGAATFQVLRIFFPDNTRFTFVSDEYNGAGVDPFGTPRPLVPVRFRSFQQAQEENGRSRVYNGVHWTWDDTQGQNIGVSIGQYLQANAFKRVRGGGDDDDRDDD